MKDAGIWVAGHALADLVTATTVRVDPRTERPVIVDGPFAESREVLGGYYVIDVPDLDAALHWAGPRPGPRVGPEVGAAGGRVRGVTSPESPAARRVGTTPPASRSPVPPAQGHYQDHRANHSSGYDQ